MKYKDALIDKVKNSSLKREVCIVLKNHNENPNKRIKRDFCHQFNYLNEKIHTHLDNISKLSYLLPIKVNAALTSPSFPIYNGSIEDCLGSINPLDNLRILVNFENIDREQLDSIISINKSISHLVEFTFLNHTDNDLNSKPSSSATIYIKNASELIQYLEEIMLDICMYYTIFDDNKIFNEEYRRKFSKKKVQLLKDKNIGVEKWNKNETNNDYVSFATIFNQSDLFDYEGYIDLWEELGKKIGIMQESKKFPDIINQLKKHKEFGELPKKAIIQEYEFLNKGEYILARIIRIPKRQKSQRTLLAIFGGNVLKRGRWRIFPKNEVPNFENYKNNVSLFKLVK